MSTAPHQSDPIYLYEDDRALADEIILAFAEDGQSVEIVPDEDTLKARIKQGASALILDRMVGDRDSLDLLQRVRPGGDRLPVIVISSLSSVDDRIYGLKAGGDDYLVKPFAMGELVARVAALRRRAGAGTPTSLSVGPLTMDLIARAVRRGDRAITLLPREFSLLEYMMRHAGQVVTRAMLLEDVWHYRLSTETNVVDVHVGNLRRKIETEGESRLIRSVRGLGFELTSDEPPP